jgi:hypothetical protein
METERIVEPKRPGPATCAARDKAEADHSAGSCQPAGDQRSTHSVDCWLVWANAVDRALIHGLRGRPSNRRLAARWKRKILTRLRERYADFGPTLTAEHFAQEGLQVTARRCASRWSRPACGTPPRNA